MTLVSDKTYKSDNNVAPHPAGFAEVYTPSDATVFTKPSRWLMITDITAKLVSLRLGGVNKSFTPISGAAGDISAAAGGVYTSPTASKFSSLQVNDAVTISGFANANNNGTFKVMANTGTQLTVKAPGSILAPNTVAETPAGTAVKIQGPPVTTQQTVVFTANPGVMYPICADQLLVTGGTTAASVICFR